MPDIRNSTVLRARQTKRAEEYPPIACSCLWSRYVFYILTPAVDGRSGSIFRRKSQQIARSRAVSRHKAVLKDENKALEIRFADGRMAVTANDGQGVAFQCPKNRT